MTFFQSFLFFVVSFLASIVGAICGIGGGIIIKPILDLFGWVSVSTISFLSGCTVLAMSSYSVGKTILAKNNQVDLKTSTPLAIGAVIGGVIGNLLFDFIKSLFETPNTVGAVQAACLTILTIGTLIYTVYKNEIQVFQVKNLLACLGIGVILGVMSSFLGIGGGPLNLVMLFFFFGMDTKTAAINSLYIIMFSQLANLITTIILGHLPAFDRITLIFMISGGIIGAMIGRKINKHLNNHAVNRLFLGLMGIIIFISICNVWKYLVL